MTRTRLLAATTAALAGFATAHAEPVLFFSEDFDDGQAPHFSASRFAINHTNAFGMFAGRFNRTSVKLRVGMPDITAPPLASGFDHAPFIPEDRDLSPNGPAGDGGAPDGGDNGGGGDDGGGGNNGGGESDGDNGDQGGGSNEDDSGGNGGGPPTVPETTWQLMVHVDFDLYAIDSWDGYESSFGEDSFEVWFGDHKAFDETIANEHRSQSMREPDEGRAQFAYNFKDDSIYRDIRASYAVDPESDVLELFFIDRLNQGLSDESWGLDNVRLSYEWVPVVPAPSGAALLGLLALSGTRRRTRG